MARHTLQLAGRKT